MQTGTIRARHNHRQKCTKIDKGKAPTIDHAVRLIHAICCLAGSPRLIDEIREELRAEQVLAAIKTWNTGPVFDWLMSALSYHGISDQVAYEYMAKHGRATYRDIEQNLSNTAFTGLLGHMPGGTCERI